MWTFNSQYFLKINYNNKKMDYRFIYLTFNHTLISAEYNKLHQATNNNASIKSKN